jgi:hypothetical protein
MTSIIKVNNLQNQCGANIISESANVITIGASGDTVTLAAGASQSGFGRSGSVNWDTTAKTTGFTAVSGNGYFCNTTSAAFTVTLPAAPSAGAIVAIADYNGTAGTNPITVGRNSSNINGSAANFTISINYASISFVYVDATAGWRSVDTSDTLSVQNQFISATGGTITTSGNFKIHTFTGPGTFTVNTTGPGSSTVDYLVVAGGGGGGARHGGGGGAGGFRTNFPSSCAGIPVTTTAYPITVGGGGTAGAFVGEPNPGANANGGKGSDSVFSTITSTGGGRGATAVSCTPCGATTLAGGSGGGGTHAGPSITAGNGNTPPVAPPQGNPGGAGMAASPYDGGGGGGATSGGDGGSGTGNGGNGTANSISGSSTSYAGGGGGGAFTGPASGAGGPGGGGAGSPTSPGVVNGTANTGGGGGGAGNNVPQGQPGQVGATGGSGIVVIRYKFQ